MNHYIHIDKKRYILLEIEKSIAKQKIILKIYNFSLIIKIM